MKALLLLCYLLTSAAGYALRALNLRHLKRHGAEVPAEFKGALDGETLARTSAYTIESNRVGLTESLTGDVILLVFMFGGLLGLYDRWIASLGSSFVVGWILFIFGISLAEGVLDIPFSLYATFRIENRYGFNTMTLQLWLSDLAKSAVIGATC